MQEVYNQVKKQPDFQKLVKLRKKVSLTLTSIVILSYFSFILIIAFYPDIFSQKISPDNATTLGIFVGLLIIIHIFLAHCRKKFELGENKLSPKFYKIVNEVPTISLIAIIIFVVLKPF